jgi:hypothetical protein
LGQFFPHSGEPFHVWIDTNGVIKAMTTGYSTTENIISSYFDGNQLTLPSRPAPYEIEISPYQSVLQTRSSLIVDKIVFSSIITSNLNLKEFNRGPIIDSLTKKHIGFRTQGDLLFLFKYMFPGFDFKDRIVLDVKNPYKYIKPKNAELLSNWMEENVYYYELKLPLHMLTDSHSENRLLFRKIMQQDFERFLKIKVSRETRKIKCRIMIRSSTEDLITSKEGKKIWERGFDNVLRIRQTPFHELFYNLQLAFLQAPILPLVNETGIMGNKLIDVDLCSDLRDIAITSKELLKYGLKIIETEKDLDVLVIKED